MDRGGCRNRAAFMVRRDRDIVGLRHDRELTNPRQAVPTDVRSQYIDRALPQQVLKNALMFDRASESQRCYGLVRNLANCLNIRHGTRLVEPEQVEPFETGGDASCIAGGQLAVAIKYEIDVG